MEINDRTTATATEQVKPYCSICGDDRNMSDMKTTHNTKQHEVYFDILGDQ